MHMIWELAKVELRRKWPFLALPAALWLFTCLLVVSATRTMYGPQRGVLSDAAGPIAIAFTFLYATILGAAIFEAGEKNGVRFCLYHHPLPRLRACILRHVLALAALALISAATVVFTPMFFATSWSEILAESPSAAVIRPIFVPVCLLLYAAASFFAPLFPSELVTIPAAVVYCVPFGYGFLRSGIPADEAGVGRGILVWAVALLAIGAVMYRRRRVLELSWPRRAATACAFWAVSAVALALTTLLSLIDPRDLLYLIGLVR